MNNIVFRYEVLSLQKVKFIFVHLFWSKLFFVDGPMTLVNFIDWMGSR